MVIYVEWATKKKKKGKVMALFKLLCVNLYAETAG